MNIQDEYNSSKRVVTFDTHDRLDDKLYKHILNLGEDKTAIKVFVANTYKNLIRANTEETIDHIN